MQIKHFFTPTIDNVITIKQWKFWDTASPLKRTKHNIIQKIPEFLRINIPALKVLNAVGSVVYAVEVDGPVDLPQLLLVVLQAYFLGFNENRFDLQASDCCECPTLLVEAFPDVKQFQPKS